MSPADQKVVDRMGILTRTEIAMKWNDPAWPESRAALTMMADDLAPRISCGHGNSMLATLSFSGTFLED
jgi:hypothetical protein